MGKGIRESGNWEMGVEASFSRDAQRSASTRSHSRGAILAVLAALLFAAVVVAQVTPPRAPVRFTAVDIFITTDQPLAAYQLECRAGSQDVLLVGIEGGETAAFAQPPYYDARALQGNRVVLAAYSLAADRPVGKTRLARLHLQVPADYDLAPSLELVAAANAAGESIEVTLEAREVGD